MLLTHFQVENLGALLSILGEKKHPMLAYRVAMTNQIVRPVLEALKAARVSAPEFTEFAQKHAQLCEECSQKDEGGRPMKKRIPVPAQNGWVDDYIIADVSVYRAGTAVLEEEYQEVIAAETVRQADIAVLLQDTVKLEFNHIIKYSWCKELLSGNNVTLLLDCGLLQFEEGLDEAIDKPVGDTSDTVEE